MRWQEQGNLFFPIGKLKIHLESFNQRYEIIAFYHGGNNTGVSIFFTGGMQALLISTLLSVRIERPLNPIRIVKFFTFNFTIRMLFLNLYKQIQQIMSKEKSPSKEKDKKSAKLSLKEKRAAKKEKREKKG